MKNNIANRVVICNKLMEYAKNDKTLCIVTSDSRGSASLAPFATSYPNQVVEVGIAEQNLVGISAGLSLGGLKPYVASPACFLTMRSIEQIKIDIAYSDTNVKLIGISSGVSYGDLGLTHHSLQDIAVLNSIVNLTIVCPADRFETEKMMETLKDHVGPVYIRVGRNAVEDSYENLNVDFKIGQSNCLKDGKDMSIIAYGDTLHLALQASKELEKSGIQARVINMHTIKPIDKQAIIKAAKETKTILVVEEHNIHNGLGATVSQITSENCPCLVKVIAFPDEVLVSGTSAELFNHYGLSVENIVEVAKEMVAK